MNFKEETGPRKMNLTTSDSESQILESFWLLKTNNLSKVAARVLDPSRVYGNKEMQVQERDHVDHGGWKGRLCQIPEVKTVTCDSDRGEGYALGTASCPSLWPFLTSVTTC